MSKPELEGGRVRAVLGRELNGLDVDRVEKDGDEYASFPFITMANWKNAAVYVHKTAEAYMVEALEVGVEPGQARGVLSDTSVAAAVLRKKMERASPREIEGIYRPLASADGLNRRILDSMEAGNFDDKKGGQLIGALNEGMVTPDVAAINGIRLAFNLAVDDVDLTERVAESARGHLEANFDVEKRQYDHLLSAFGRGGPIESNKIFMQSLSLGVIALSFPMDDHEADVHLSNLASHLD